MRFKHTAWVGLFVATLGFGCAPADSDSSAEPDSSTTQVETNTDQVAKEGSSEATSEDGNDSLVKVSLSVPNMV